MLYRLLILFSWGYGATTRTLIKQHCIEFRDIISNIIIDGFPHDDCSVDTFLGDCGHDRMVQCYLVRKFIAVGHEKLEMSIWNDAFPFPMNRRINRGFRNRKAREKYQVQPSWNEAACIVNLVRNRAIAHLLRKSINTLCRYLKTTILIVGEHPTYK